MTKIIVEYLTQKGSKRTAEHKVYTSLESLEKDLIANFPDNPAIVVSFARINDKNQDILRKSITVKDLLEKVKNAKDLKATQP